MEESEVMRTVQIPSHYYQVFDLDFTREIPAEGIGGWKMKDLPFSLDHSALVVMHAWDVGTREEFPGWHRVVEYFPRAEKILQGPLPKLLQAARSASLKIYHVSAGEISCRHLPGYQRTLDFAGPPEPGGEQIATDLVHRQLQAFREAEGYLGTHNRSDIEAGFQRLAFPKEAFPPPEEDVVVDSPQLFALCQRDGINHLVYAGFALNVCLHQVGGGMLDMARKGLMCSTIREVVTATENKETARGELAKENALWRVSTGFGFVYDLESFAEGILSAPECAGRES